MGCAMGCVGQCAMPDQLLMGKAVMVSPHIRQADVLLCAHKAAWLCWELLGPCRSVQPSYAVAAHMQGGVLRAAGMPSCA